MGIQAQLSDGSILEFPEGTSDAVIDRVVRNHVTGMAPEASFTEKATHAVVGDNPVRDLALGARGVATGAMTLPLMAGDALNSLINYGIKGINLTGTNIPTLPMVSQSFDALLNRSGAPTPQTPAEKLQFQINRGGAAGIAFPAAGNSGALMGLQGVAGALSGGAAQAAENAGINPILATGVGALAGMAVPTSPDLFGILKRGGGAAVQPFAQGGREEIVGNALARMATKPKDAVMNIGQAADDVSQLTTAQASRDPGLLSTERALANLPGSGGRISNAYAEQNSARRALLDSLAKTPEDLAKAKAARAEDAERLYEPAFNKPIMPTEALVSISKRPAFEQAAKKAVEIAGNEGLDLTNPTNTMRGLHYVKKGVDQLIEEAKPGSPQFRSLTIMKNDLLSAMDDVSPAYKAAREDFARQSKPINQMELLQEIKQRTLNSGLDSQGNRVLSQAKWTNAVTDNLPDLKKTLNPEQVSTLQRIAKDLDYGKMSEMGGKVSGSNTFQNLSVANVLGAALGKEAAESPFAQSLLRPLGFLYHLPERQVEELMIEAMLDKGLALKLMSRANESNIQDLARGLSQRLKASSKGSIAGQMGGGV